MSEHPVVIFTDHPSTDLDLELSLLNEAGIVGRLLDPGRSLSDQLADARAIVTCFEQVTAEMIRAPQQLEVIARFGIGVDNIDVDCASERCVPVVNVPSYCQDEVAEHVLACLLALARRLCVLDRTVRAGGWSIEPAMPTYRVTGKTLGLVGFGTIAQAIAARAAGLGLDVVAHDPWVPMETIAEAGVRPVDLEQLLEDSDFVSLHTALNKQTRGLIGRAELQRMRGRAYLMNASRGAVVDLEALAQALREGWIAGAALDVFDPEVPPVDHPLVGLPNLLLTPHVAFYSEESMLDLRRLTIRNVVAALAGRSLPDIVNAEALASRGTEHP